MRSNRVDQTSRRVVLQTGLAALATTGLSCRAQAQEKLAQKVVQYQTTPKNGQMCSNCVQFLPPDACKLVAGTISPNGWCMVFGPKSG